MQPLRNYLKDQMILYVFVSVLFVVGVVFGSLMVNALSLDQQQELGRYLGHFFSTVDQGGVSGESAFWDTAMGHVKWIAIIWILGLSVVGLPFILVLDFMKGVLVGFTVGYFVGQYSWKGLLFALVSVAPQNIVVIPGIIISSVAAIGFSLYMLRNRVLTQRRGQIKQPFVSYSALTLTMAVAMVGIALFEAWVSPVMMRWVAPMLLESVAMVRI
ncbi:stage II sporulation protein M [Paenibacillus sp. MSJ-34]|uniref:stage II sporulation protein M n=1 Tax=Paenibacillus sp. MSJ-34 TaxID=2841529 RepID=UPI001C1095D7|nr:stage II sporulation protein M [Paenibacillus sp. MSJ-34]MBU5442996.1 stage II sporulation protein M [Paenibacillus sp. MSJ-34]